MRNSKVNTKNKSAIPGKAISQKEVKALVKEAEKGPFKPIENLVEDVKLQWQKKTTSHGKIQLANDESFSKEEFIALVREGEKGPFKSMDNFVEDIKALWKEKYGK